MRRAGVIALLIFEAVWLNAFLPGHTRGVITVAQTSCCAQKDTPQKPQKQPLDQSAKCCAVCFFAARLTVTAAAIIELPPAALVDELPLPAPAAVASTARIGVFDSRGPPAV
jgi:hypothetical protein